jgi:hypothetical protein
MIFCVGKGTCYDAGIKDKSHGEYRGFLYISVQSNYLLLKRYPKLIPMQEFLISLLPASPTTRLRMPYV